MKAKGNGVKAALKRNPNTHSGLNEAPEGPSPHVMHESGSGGMKGDASCTHRGSKFYIK